MQWFIIVLFLQLERQQLRPIRFDTMLREGTITTVEYQTIGWGKYVDETVLHGYKNMCVSFTNVVIQGCLFLCVLFIIISVLLFFIMIWLLACVFFVNQLRGQHVPGG